jgi:peptidoglycan hydrolase CwlO-like protein
MDNLTTAIVTLITVLFSAGAWRFYETKMKLKSVEKKYEKTDQNMYRDDLRERVKNLEKQLHDSFLKESETQNQILELTSEVAELRTKVTFLEKENERLRTVR